MLSFWTFIKESWKKFIVVSTKILYNATVLNIGNSKECFLSSKSAYLNDSEGSCDTEDWMAAENSALHHRNKLHFKIFSKH